MESTGKEQINAGLTLDSPLFLYDQFSVSWNSNAAFGRDDAATRAGSVNYSIPFGYWTLFAGASRSRYRQTVAGFDEPIIYAGTTKQVDIGVSVVPYRGSTYKGTVMFKLLRKRSTARSTTSTSRCSAATSPAMNSATGIATTWARPRWTSAAACAAPQWSNQSGYVYGDPDWNGRSTILTANAGLYLPFKLSGQQLAYQANWQIQHAKTAIVPSDYFTIGNRYAVRGFDGQMTLASEDGWSLRNDLSLNLGDLGQQLYVGLDVGRVGGQSAVPVRPHPGRFRRWPARPCGLARCCQCSQRQLRPVAGLAAQKPESLKTQHTVFAASLMFEF